VPCAIVPGAPALAPTNLAPLPRLLAYVQDLGVGALLAPRARRGGPLLAVVLVWLVLAWKGTGRPHRAAAVLADPVVLAVLGRVHLPDAETLRRGLGALPAKAVRAAVEASYLAELDHREGRVWAAVDAHQLPYWGRGQKGKLKKGWSGAHGKRLRGYRLCVVTDTETGQVITFLLARGDARDAAMRAVLTARATALLGQRLAGVVADCGFTSTGSAAALGRPLAPAARAAAPPRRRGDPAGGLPVGPGAPFGGGGRPHARRHAGAVGLRHEKVIARYRRRACAEQAIEELKNGSDVDHLVATRLHPNRAAVGLRIVARNAALGLQIDAAGRRPEHLREAPAFRAAHVEGLGLCSTAGRTVTVTPSAPPPAHAPRRIHLPWTRRTVHLAA